MSTTRFCAAATASPVGTFLPALAGPARLDPVHRKLAAIDGVGAPMRQTHVVISAANRVCPADDCCNRGWVTLQKGDYIADDLLSRSPLVIILLVASGLSAATGDVASFVVVVTIVTTSISLDFVQEVRAQNADEALRRSVAVQATVRRDGASLSVPIDQLVSGDIVELIAGDLVPADSRLLESRDLFVNQALLTGEPYPAEKQASDAALGAENSAGASNAVFAGTSVISGTAAIVICRTGGRTALGHLATSLAEKPPATAFAVGIRRFGMLIMWLTVFMVLFVLVVNISFQRPVLESLMFALALAVGLTPELLPMIVTVTLVRSAIELARRKVIVKRLSAIHDLAP